MHTDVASLVLSATVNGRDIVELPLNARLRLSELKKECGPFVSLICRDSRQGPRAVRQGCQNGAARGARMGVDDRDGFSVRWGRICCGRRGGRRQKRPAAVGPVRTFVVTPWN